jgi:signal transduction histidine kinase
VADGDLTARVQERGPRAMRGVARAFNTMSARLAASEEQRRRLLADVGHELRTPLTVVQGNLEALIDGVRPADAEHLRAILDETRVVSRLVEDLGTLSVAEAGALPLHREPTDLGALARETANSYASQAASAGVRIVAEANDAALVDADPVRIREVLANLVANAIRYTPADGLVRIVVGREPSAVRVSVSDTGVGIPAEAIDHIFERFYKSPQSRGAGLGLAIAKQLVQAHGGTIAATSVPGQGTEIRFTIPVGSS